MRVLDRSSPEDDNPSMTLSRITFGMIVLNGEPFVRYNLRHLYPYACQIIVVEGATPFAGHAASEDGHSRDGTLDVLRRFKKEEDPADKVTIVTAEDEGYSDGFWPGEKNEMSQAYARRATGDWLWQVDSDEFYRDYDFEAVFRLLVERPDTTAVSFLQYKFFASPDYFVNGPFMWGHTRRREYHRLFRWGQGYRYVEHRPPTVVDDQGRDLRSLHWIDASETASKGIRLFHYSMLFPEQVDQKVGYYRSHTWRKADQDDDWMLNAWKCLRRPFHIHNVPHLLGWTNRYRGRWPEQVEKMWSDISEEQHGVSVRGTDDIERLLSSPVFHALTWCLRLWPNDESMSKPFRTGWRRMLEHAVGSFERHWGRSR